MREVSRKPPSRITRVLLRLPADLHRALVKTAAEHKLSFNEFCVRRLRVPSDARDLSAVRTMVVTRARAAFGEGLLGVLVLGSWARGDAATGSDIDVMIVINSKTPLTRDLYRTWDLEPLSWEGRAIDAHFAHIARAGSPPTGVWCEAAVDGQLWYDRDGALAIRLGEARRAIAEGRVVRGFAHGQPYWKGAA